VIGRGEWTERSLFTSLFWRYTENFWKFFHKTVSKKNERGVLVLGYERKISAGNNRKITVDYCVD